MMQAEMIPVVGSSGLSAGRNTEMSRWLHYILDTRYVLEFECLSCMVFNRTRNIQFISHPIVFSNIGPAFTCHLTCTMQWKLSHFSRQVLYRDFVRGYWRGLLLCEPAVQFTCGRPSEFRLWTIRNGSCVSPYIMLWMCPTHGWVRIVPALLFPNFRKFWKSSWLPSCVSWGMVCRGYFSFLQKIIAISFWDDLYMCYPFSLLSGWYTSCW